MSTLSAVEIPVPELYTGAQISYDRREWIVFEVVEMAIGGWTVTAAAVDDVASPPKRWSLPYANRFAKALLVHREVAR